LLQPLALRALLHKRMVAGTVTSEMRAMGIGGMIDTTGAMTAAIGGTFGETFR